MLKEKKRSPFGKKFKVLRVLHDEDISEAANFLKVSPSYITCVEYGDRDIPVGWINKIVDHYKLTGRDKDELLKSVRESPCHRKVELSELEQILLNFVDNISNGDEKVKKEGIVRIKRMIDDLRRKKEEIKHADKTK